MIRENRTVYPVKSTDPKNNAFGTGFVISIQQNCSYLVTCGHVVLQVGGKVSVEVAGMPAEVVAWNESGSPDLALLRIRKALPAQPPLLAKASPGSFVSSSGYYRHTSSQGNSVTNKRITGRLAISPHRDEVATDSITLWPLEFDRDSTIEQGFSGAPIFDENGAVVGVAHLRLGRDRGFAVAIEELSRIGIPEEIKFNLPLSSANGPVFSKKVIGFDSQLAMLEKQTRRMLGGQAVVVLIVGERGTGKSTLMTDWVGSTMAARPEILHLSGEIRSDARGHSRDQPHQPFKRIFQNLLKSTRTTADGRRPLEIVARTLIDCGITKPYDFAEFCGTSTRDLQAEISRLSDKSLYHENDYGPVASSQEAASERKRDLIASSLDTVSQSFPLILRLEDLHLADRSSLEMLSLLADRLQNRRILFACTWLEEDDKEDWDRLLPLGLEKVRTNFDDSPEAKSFCEQYLRTQYGADIAVELAEPLFKLTAGNPLFINEYLLYLRTQGIKLEEWTEFVLRELPTVDQTANGKLTRIIKCRFHELSPELANLLKVASVHGSTFTAEVIARITASDPQAVMRDLNKLVALRFITFERTETLHSGAEFHFYRFLHELVQRHIYDNEVAAEERRRLHAAIGSAIEELWTGSYDRIAAQLADHFAQAELSGKTLRYCFIAAKLWEEQGCWNEATKFAHMALPLRPDTSSDNLLRISSYVQLCRIYAEGTLRSGGLGTTSDIKDGIKALEDCAPFLQQIEPGLAGDVYLTLARLRNAIRLGDDKVDESADRAIRKYRESYEQGLIAAMSRSFEPNPACPPLADSALLKLRTALRQAQSFHNSRMAVRVLQDIAQLLINFPVSDSDPLHKAESCAKKAISLSASTDSTEQLRSRITRSWVWHHQGKYTPQLRKERVGIVEMAHHIRCRSIEAEARTDLAHFDSYFVKRQSDAERTMRAAYEFRLRTGYHGVQDTEHLAQFLFRRGQYDEAIKIVKPAIEKMDTWREWRTRAFVALMLLLQEKRDDAKSEICKIEEGLRSLRGNLQFASTHLMQAYAILHRRAASRRQIERLQQRLKGSAKRGLFWTYEDHPTDIAYVEYILGNIQWAWQWIQRANQYWKTVAKTCAGNENDTSVLEELVMYWEYQYVRARILLKQGNAGGPPLLEKCVDVLCNAGHRFGLEGKAVLDSKAA